MSKPGGRPKDPIWGYYSEVTSEGPSKAKCKKCQHILTARPIRMKAHTKKSNKDVLDIESEKCNDSNKTQTNEEVLPNAETLEINTDSSKAHKLLSTIIYR